MRLQKKGLWHEIQQGTIGWHRIKESMTSKGVGHLKQVHGVYNRLRFQAFASHSSITSKCEDTVLNNKMVEWQHASTMVPSPSTNCLICLPQLYHWYYYCKLKREDGCSHITGLEHFGLAIVWVFQQVTSWYQKCTGMNDEVTTERTRVDSTMYTHQNRS